jgi:hypothetical protein
MTFTKIGYLSTLVEITAIFQTYLSTAFFNIIFLRDCDYVGLWQLVTSVIVYEHDDGLQGSTVHDSGEYQSTV